LFTNILFDLNIKLFDSKFFVTLQLKREIPRIVNNTIFV
jgi:hypothetical protein